MTNEEAIKAISDNMPTSGYYILREALGMAIEALEKQIPQKPIWHAFSTYKNENVKNGAWKCPNCLRIDYVQRHTYCGFCGQMIDWREG